MLDIICRRLESDATPLLAPALMQYDTINALLAIMAEALQTASSSMAAASQTASMSGSPTKTGTSNDSTAPKPAGSSLASLVEPASRVEVILHTFLALIQGDVDRRAANFTAQQSTIKAS